MEEIKKIDIDDMVKNFGKKIDEKTEQLKTLLKEKLELLHQYKTASSSQKIIIEKEMLKSKNKFEDLLKDVDDLTKKIKKIKDENCD